MARVEHVEVFGSAGFHRCDDVRVLFLLPPAFQLAVNSNLHPIPVIEVLFASSCSFFVGFLSVLYIF